MKTLLALFTLLSLSTSAFAALPSFGPLVQKAVLEGEKSDLLESVTYHFTHGEEENTGQPRQVDYLTVAGLEVLGVFRASSVSLVKEDWQINAEGNREVYQWIRTFNLAGELTFLRYAKIIETPDGSVLDIVELPNGGREDALERTHAEREMMAWLARLGLNLQR